MSRKEANHVEKQTWKPEKGWMHKGRKLEIFTHCAAPEWGYPQDQTDNFIIMYPKIKIENPPLLVILHSSGGGFLESIVRNDMLTEYSNIYAPDEFYVLMPDCGGNRCENEWWWGGNSKEEGMAPVEKRVLDYVEWTVDKYDLNLNRIYLAGISMGGSGSLGIGMPHGDIFAAVSAVVPAHVRHFSKHLGVKPFELPEDTKLPDPPVLITHSGINDKWSDGQEIVYSTMKDRKYALISTWGDTGHDATVPGVSKANDLFGRFPWHNICKNEAYPVFTNASSDQQHPWPDNRESGEPGQINAFFRWKNISDSGDKFEMHLFIMESEAENAIVNVAESSTADISLRRLLNFKIASGENIKWFFGKQSGIVKADKDGFVTIKHLTVTKSGDLLVLNKK